MKALAAAISFVLLLPHMPCFGAVVGNYEDLLEASEHGHETGLANKGKRCHEPLHLPLYDHFLGLALPAKRPASLLKRHASREVSQPSNELVQMASRFRSAEPEAGLSEAQERYYTVGAFGPGPKQQILTKLLNIPQDVRLERLVVLAKNKSKLKATRVPHPVVIDTAHVFMSNDGKPAELDLELHGVKGDRAEDINNLTNQLNKELDAAISTKKSMLGDSHLTPQEIDKIIEHVVEQLKKKTSGITRPDKDVVGSTMDLTKAAESELDDDLAGFKKKGKKKGSKKHGFVNEEADLVGEHSPNEESANLADDTAEVPIKHEEETLLGIKKHQSIQQYSKGHDHTKTKGNKYRENDENPLHADIAAEELESLNDANIEGDSIAMEAPKSQESNVEPMETPNANTHDSTLGTFSKFKVKDGYGNGGYGEDSYGKGKLKFKPLKLHKKKGFYRENDADEQEEAAVGSAEPVYHQGQQQFQDYQKTGDYAAAGNQQQYATNQPTYEETYADEYPQDVPVYEQVEPETYHGSAPSYPTPESYNNYQPNYQPSYPAQQEHQYQPVVQPQGQYQQPHAFYQQPAYIQPQQPAQYVPSPNQDQPQEAYSGANIYKSVNVGSEPEEAVSEDEIEEVGDNVSTADNILGTSQNVPEDPNLKASFFENEVKRLRQWIADNAPNAITTHDEKPTPTHRKNEESAEKEELVDKFTKVIEKDLTDGKKLTPTEKKNLDRKIAKMVRDNLNDDDVKTAEAKTRKKLDKLEELVEEEADENEESVGAVEDKVSSNLGDFQSRFSGNDEKEKTTHEETEATKKMIGFGNLLKSSLANLNKEMRKPTEKPLVDLNNLAENLKAMPNKFADLIKPTTAVPKLGSRSSMADKDKAETQNIVGQSKISKSTSKKADKVDLAKSSSDTEDETVGCLEDLMGKKDKKDKDYGPEWYVDPEYYHDDYHGHDDYHHDGHQDGHHGGYGEYREADKKSDALSKLDKLLHPKHHALKKGSAERSGEEDEPKTLPDIIRQIEENLEESLHLPQLPGLPSMRENHHGHHRAHQSTRPLPKIQVNGEEFVPAAQDVQPVLPEMPPRGLPPPPAFQGRNFPANGPAHFDMPLPNQNRQLQGFQRPGEPFVGAPQPQPAHHQPILNQDMSYFGAMVPQHLHDIHQRDVSEQMRKQHMYFIGDGIKLPLQVHHHKDGTFHLSIDLQRLCKCNDGNCKPTTAKGNEPEPELIATNILGTKQGDNLEIKEMDIADVPLMMKTPNFEEEEAQRGEKSAKKTKITKRSPRFNHIDVHRDEIGKDGEYVTDDEQLDYMQHIPIAIKEDAEHKIESFNKDVKDYYQNEADIKQERMNHGDLTGFLVKRVGLLTNILRVLNDVTFGD